MNDKTQTINDRMLALRGDLPAGESKKLAGEIARLLDKADAQKWANSVREKSLALLAAEYEKRLARIQAERRAQRAANDAANAEKEAQRKRDAHNNIVVGAVLVKIAGRDAVLRTSDNGLADKAATEAAIRTLLRLPATQSDAPVARAVSPGAPATPTKVDLSL